MAGAGAVGGVDGLSSPVGGEGVGGNAEANSGPRLTGTLTWQGRDVGFVIADLERARRVAVALEQENAHLRAAIAAISGIADNYDGTTNVLGDVIEACGAALDEHRDTP